MSAPTSEIPVAITVNGVATEHEVEARTLLVQYLREVVGLTGTNIGCDSTSCSVATPLTVIATGMSVVGAAMRATLPVRFRASFAGSADQGHATRVSSTATSSE